MSIRNTYPTIRPSLNLNFARSRTLDPRITFSRSSVGTYMDSDGLIKTAIADQPRFDHRYVNGQIESLGLLVEEQRSNLVKLSNDFSSNFWAGYCGGKSNITYNTTDVISPDGANNATKIARGSNGCDGSLSWGFHWNSSTGGIIIDTTNTFTASIYARGAVGGEVINVGFNDSQMTNHTLTTSWQRISRIGIANTTDRGFQVKSDAINQTFYIWGAQLEQGAFPTSYIPTSGGTGTRNADNVSMVGENFSSWFNQTEGSLYVDMGDYKSSLTGNFGISLGSSSTNYLALPYINASGSLTGDLYWRDASVTETINFPSGGSAAKYAIAYKNGQRLTGYFNGSLSEDTVGPWPNPSGFNSLYIGRSHFNISRYHTCYYKQLLYYSKPITNTQLQNLTK